MPITIELDMLPMGVSLSNAAAEDETVTVLAREFLSSEDGNDLIERLDGVSNTFPTVVGPTATRPSQVDTFLAIISKERKATVYCNELQQVATVRAKRPIKAGEAISKSDIADLHSLQLLDRTSTPIRIPADHGFEIILSVGWRKCLYYDYTVFFKDAPDRTDDLPALFGRCYGQMLFQEMYSISEQQWATMTSLGWFPFIWMTDQDRKMLISFCKMDQPPYSVFEGICTAFKAVVQSRTDSWKKSKLLGEHSDFIDAAVARYLADDYVSCISILYPRIEGVLRGLHIGLGSPGAPTQKIMASNLVRSMDDHSLLLPRRFEAYLREFYFRAFDKKAGVLPLSRNTVGHGVSQVQDYDLIRASLGFMILDQMFYYLLD